MKYIFFSVIAAFFLIVGIALPYVNEDFENTTPEYDVDSHLAGIGQAPIDSTVQVKDVFVSVITMFFWTFGALPIYIEFIFLFLRLIFYAILVDLLWIG